MPGPQGRGRPLPRGSLPGRAWADCGHQAISGLGFLQDLGLLVFFFCRIVDIGVSIFF